MLTNQAQLLAIEDTAENLEIQEDQREQNFASNRVTEEVDAANGSSPIEQCKMSIQVLPERHDEAGIIEDEIDVALKELGMKCSDVTHVERRSDLQPSDTGNSSVWSIDSRLFNSNSEMRKMFGRISAESSSRSVRHKPRRRQYLVQFKLSICFHMIDFRGLNGPLLLSLTDFP